MFSLKFSYSKCFVGSIRLYFRLNVGVGKRMAFFTALIAALPSFFGGNVFQSGEFQIIMYRMHI